MRDKIRENILKIILFLSFPLALYFSFVSLLYYSVSRSEQTSILITILGTLILGIILFWSHSDILKIKSKTPLKSYFFHFLLGGVGTFAFCFILILIVGFTILKFTESQGVSTHPEMPIYVGMVALLVANLWALPGACFYSWWLVSKGAD